jgi:hypothetical protein
VRASKNRVRHQQCKNERYVFLFPLSVVAAEKTVFGFGSPQAYVSKEQLENWKQAQ